VYPKVPLLHQGPNNWQPARQKMRGPVELHYPPCHSPYDALCIDTHVVQCDVHVVHTYVVQRDVHVVHGFVPIVANSHSVFTTFCELNSEKGAPDIMTTIGLFV
jgi:hypothetical protein